MSLDQQLVSIPKGPDKHMIVITNKEFVAIIPPDKEWDIDSLLIKAASDNPISHVSVPLLSLPL
jgi:hypothetical protein